MSVNTADMGGITPEQAAQMKQIVDSGKSNETAVEFVERLDKMQRSKGFVEIRDKMTQNMLREIRKDVDLYKKFQSIRVECKQSWDYDHRMATIEDVNRACTNLYGIILKILKSETSSFDPVLNKMGQAINNIEERLGMPQTQWNEEDHSDGNAGDTGNVQSITPSGE